MNNKLLPLKVEGFAVPIGSEINDLLFHFMIRTNQGVKYVELNITCVTDDLAMVALLSGQDSGTVFSIVMPLNPTHNQLTMYLDIKTYEYKQPGMHRFSEGYKQEDGYLRIHGTLLSNAPEQSQSLSEVVDELNKRELLLIDHTDGKGTWYEQLAK